MPAVCDEMLVKLGGEKKASSTRAVMTPQEINSGRLRFHEFGFGPAGFISPDDIDIMERNQLGIQARGNDRSFIGRGLHRDHISPDGGASGYTMDECHLRGMWQHYRALMREAPQAIG